ncbi:hypothetical protein N665_0076s0053 [Sinapis alba]|nr:hypothetical protein N665_0076s0053 [Sinapis alba]
MEKFKNRTKKDRRRRSHSSAKPKLKNPLGLHRRRSVSKSPSPEELKMAKSCKGLAEELVKCLSESMCVKDEKRSIRDCAGEKSPCIPSECVGLRETYFNCKRGQVDMRARIRGNKGY